MEKIYINFPRFIQVTYLLFFPHNRDRNFKNKKWSWFVQLTPYRQDSAANTMNKVKHKLSFKFNWNIEEKNAVLIQICKVYAPPSALKNNVKAQMIIFIWLKIQFSTENRLLCRASNQVYSASPPMKTEINRMSAELSRATSTAVLMNHTPWKSCFTSRDFSFKCVKCFFIVPHNIKGLCPFSSSKINNVSWSQSVGLPPLFSDWINMKYPCDISDGQPAVAGMAIIMQNAPSSDKRGAALGLGGTWGR